MELLDATQAMDKYGSPNTLTLNEIGSVLEIARIGKNDIFYDLGSGHGRIVRMVAKKTPARQSNGIESDITRFCKSISITNRCLTEGKLTKNQHKRIEF
jgi:Histone methylation protein DOT1